MIVAVKIRIKLVSTILVCTTLLPGALRAQSLWAAYQASPDTCTNLPNCSYAGYHRGEAALPSPAVSINVKNPPYSAVGDGVTDDTAALRAALTNSGVVYFPDGTYNCSGVLFVHKSNTIIRGQSRSNTIIQFTKSLLTGYAQNSSGTSSRWSWTGGMLMFCPATKNTYLASTNDIGGTWSDSWTVGSQITTVTGTHVRGSKTITVANGASLAAGQFIFIRVDNVADLSLLKHYCGDDSWAENYDWSTTNSDGVLPANRATIDWPVEIASVSGTNVTLRQPLRTDLRPAWNPRVRAAGDVIRECGLENLTIKLARDYTYIYSTHHNKEPGWNGPWFNNALHCFVRGVTVLDPDSGFLISAGKNITMTDFRIDFTAANRRAHHHGTVARASTHDCLWENFVLAAEPRHGIHIESFSAGNVWSKGTMNFGTFDSHKALPYECLRTEIVLNNSGIAGGGTDDGPRMGVRFAHWNVLTTSNRNHMIGEADIMPKGAVVGVRGCNINNPVHPEYGDSLCVVDLSGPVGGVPNPINLYEAQKALRLGVPPAIATPPTSRTNFAGTTATFTVTATGDAPLSYQWLRSSTNLLNGGGISGVMTQTLTIASVALSDAASYRVVITNVAGSVTSALAVLTVNLPQPDVITGIQISNGLARLTVSGNAGLTYQVQAATNLSPPVNWVSFSTNVAGVNGDFQITDPDLATLLQRYYRVIR